jgi:hypothetical protein
MFTSFHLKSIFKLYYLFFITINLVLYLDIIASINLKFLKLIFLFVKQRSQYVEIFLFFIQFHYHFYSNFDLIFIINY